MGPLLVSIAVATYTFLRKALHDSQAQASALQSSSSPAVAVEGAPVAAWETGSQWRTVARRRRRRVLSTAEEEDEVAEGGAVAASPMVALARAAAAASSASPCQRHVQATSGGSSAGSGDDSTDGCWHSAQAAVRSPPRHSRTGTVASTRGTQPQRPYYPAVLGSASPQPCERAPVSPSRTPALRRRRLDAARPAVAGLGKRLYEPSSPTQASATSRPHRLASSRLAAQAPRNAQ